MAGICPDEANAGFRHFILRPNPDTRKTLRYQQERITSADADFFSTYGHIKAAWRCDGGVAMTYNVTIPANTTATLYMPIAEGYELKESGQPVAECADIEYLGTENGRVVCRLGSGSYRFSVDNSVGVGTVHDSFDSHLTPVYNIGGMYVGQATDTLPHGVYIQSGRKIVK